MTIRSMTLKPIEALDPADKSVEITADGTTYAPISESALRGTDRIPQLPEEVEKAAREMVSFEPDDDSYTPLSDFKGEFGDA